MVLPERRQGGDRRHERKYRYRDRRSGFQRRTAGVKMNIVNRCLYSLRDRPKVLAGILIGANVLNLADFLLTLFALEAGGREANPILRPLLALDPMWAGLFKLVVVAAASLLVWKSRYYRQALVVGVLIGAVFACLIVYHVVLLTRLY